LSQSNWRQRMGAAHQRTATEGLLRQRPAGCHGGGLAPAVRHLLRHHRRPGVWFAGRRRHLETNRTRPPGGSVSRGPDTAMIRVVLPYHLRTLARVEGEVQLEVQSPATVRSVLDALEARYPMLCGTIR